MSWWRQCKRNLQSSFRKEDVDSRWKARWPVEDTVNWHTVPARGRFSLSFLLKVHSVRRMFEGLYLTNVTQMLQVKFRSVYNLCNRCFKVWMACVISVAARACWTLCHTFVFQAFNSEAIHWVQFAVPPRIFPGTKVWLTNEKESRDMNVTRNTWFVQ